jgi:hypothetical protein
VTIDLCWWINSGAAHLQTALVYLFDVYTYLLLNSNCTPRGHVKRCTPDSSAGLYHTLISKYPPREGLNPKVVGTNFFDNFFSELSSFMMIFGSPKNIRDKHPFKEKLPHLSEL